MSRQWIQIKNVANIEDLDVLLYLDPDHWVDNQIILKKFESYTVNFIIDFLRSLNKQAVCVDVGANIGYFTILMSNFSNKVYSFEPVQEYFSILKDICLKNNIDKKVSLHNFALSSENKKVDVNITSESATMYMLDGWEIKNLRDVESVQCFKMDDIIKEKVDIIKIDCDGHDPFVLQGAEGIIKEYKPIIIIEVAKDYYLKSNWSFDKFYSYVTDLQYNMAIDTSRRNILNRDSFLELKNMYYSSVNIICMPT